MAISTMNDPPLDGGTESRASGVSWAAVFAGAFVTVSTGLMLIALGAGIGFASVSPWSGSGVSAGSLTVGVAIWLIVVQWLSAALGAYVTGRLRTKWVGVHSDEVSFRDTAHGLLTWSVAAVFGALILGSAATSVLGGAATSAGASAGQSASDPNAYFVDMLYRRTASSQTATGAIDPRPEAIRIFAVSLKNGAISPADKAYLAQSIASRTGVSPQEADKRVDDVLNEAKAAVDATRKNASKVSFYTFFSMLVGAFIAAAAGALGGRGRDAHA